MLHSKGCQLRVVLSLCIGVVMALAAPSSLRGQTAPPATEKQQVADTYYGQTVTDPYRWLESWHDAKVAQWLKAQDEYTRATLARFRDARNSWLG